jgi:hypothetical protein
MAQKSGSRETSQEWALPFFWKKKGGWYIYNWENETYYLMSPVHIPNNGKKSPYQGD